MLLLDEPTNHLDIAAIEWLETWLQRFRGAFVAISHDRMFLSRLTKSSLWLDRGTVRRAEIGFGGFEAWTEAVAAEEAKSADKLDNQLRAELHWLQRGVTARRKRNQGRLSKLGEMRELRKSMTGPVGVAKLATVTDDAKTKVVIDAEHVTKRFGERTVIGDLSLRVQRGDRIGVIGPNGTGKTTLLRLLTGEIEPDAGRIRRAKTIESILIDQKRARLVPGQTVREIIADGGDWVDVGGVRKHVAGYLKDFLFDPGVLDAKIETFSGGEQSRLLLAREFARVSNLLILDEPTNDLDLETLDLLQEVIADYAGTVLDRQPRPRLPRPDGDRRRRARWQRQGRRRGGRLQRLGGEARRRGAPRPLPRRAGQGRRRHPPPDGQADLYRAARARQPARRDRRDDARHRRRRGDARRPCALYPRPRPLRPGQRRGRRAPGQAGGRRRALAGAGGEGRGARDGMIYIALNAVPILLATLAALAIGLAVYPALRSVRGSLAVFVAEFWFAAILAGALILAPPKANPWVMAVGTAVVIWIGFVVPALVVTGRGRGVSAAGIMRDAGHWLLVMVVEAAVLHAIGLTRAAGLGITPYAAYRSIWRNYRVKSMQRLAKLRGKSVSAPGHMVPENVSASMAWPPPNEASAGYVVPAPPKIANHVHLTGTIARKRYSSTSGDRVLWDDELAGFGLRLRKTRGVGGSWIVKFRSRGAVRRVTLGKTENMDATEARAAAKRLLASAALDGLPKRPETPKVPTFEAYFPEFWRDYSRHWKPSTQETSAGAFPPRAAAFPWRDEPRRDQQKRRRSVARRLRRNTRRRVQSGGPDPLRHAQLRRASRLPAEGFEPLPGVSRGTSAICPNAT